MKTRTVTVHAADGSGDTKPAELVQCEECDGEAFTLYLIDENHMHVQCLNCGSTFCDGSDESDDMMPPPEGGGHVS